MFFSIAANLGLMLWICSAGAPQADLLIEERPPLKITPLKLSQQPPPELPTRMESTLPEDPSRKETRRPERSSPSIPTPVIRLPSSVRWDEIPAGYVAVLEPGDVLENPGLDSLEPVAVPSAPATTASGPHQAGDLDSPPTVLRRRRPRYPLAARRAEIEGSVTLRVLVAADGSIDQVEVEAWTGSRQLAEAAARAMKRWRFRPGRLDGRNVAAWCSQTIHFELIDD